MNAKSFTSIHSYIRLNICCPWVKKNEFYLNSSWEAVTVFSVSQGSVLNENGWHLYYKVLVTSSIIPCIGADTFFFVLVN